MQRSLRSLLPVDTADINGLISGNVKYYVGRLTVSHHAFRKLGHVSLQDGTKNALEQYILIKIIEGPIQSIITLMRFV